jgi:glycosyltransferase involved in cell wall biosynthesis
MNRISAVIITFNEANCIERCIQSLLNVADEIVVLDSYSTDSSRAIAEQLGAKVVLTKWMGYAATKNYANTLAKYDWILSIDADEVLSRELAHNLLEWKSQKKNTFVSFNRLTNYCGTFIRHGGWYPDMKLRLFDRRVAEWKGHIHETVAYPNSIVVEHAKGDLLHYSYTSVEQHYQQARKFSFLAAEDLKNKNKKRSLFLAFWSACYKWIQGYLLQLGFLDGWAGWKIALISSKAVWWKYANLNQLYTDEK